MNSTRVSYFGLAVIASIVFVFSLGLLFLVKVTPRDAAKFAASALVVIGGFNVLLHRRLGSQVYRWGKNSLHEFISSFWQRLGELGAQRFYFAVGVLLLITGFALFLKGRNVF